MSALFIVGAKCTLAASHAAPGESHCIGAARSIKVRKNRIVRRTDGRTPDVCFPLDAATIIIS